MSAEEMAEAMYPESEMTYGYQAVREAFEYGYAAAAQRVQPSREDAVRAIRAADWWPIDAPHGLDDIAADAVLALFAQQPTVAEVARKAWARGYSDAMGDYEHSDPLPPNPYGESEARS